MVGEAKKHIFSGYSTRDGAGVKLVRIFSNETVELTDPFLLLDSFGSINPEDYTKGFPWHPHRGIETVTYMLSGVTEHEDNIGNKGVIKEGDVQWMTAGRGILHQEMPKDTGKELKGMQLWVNMPKKNKMMAPRYRGVTSKEFPVIKKEGAEIKIISGSYETKTGPVKHLVVDVEYFDITLQKDNDFSYSPNKGYTTFCYIIRGQGEFDSSHLKESQLVLWRGIKNVLVKADSKLHFILVSGKPLNEPIAWGGPIVMNTEKELQEAYSELENGTFIS